MINSVRGTVTEKREDQVFLDTGGVEWAIQATKSAIEQLPATGERGRIHVYLHHRENLMQLFGFADQCERELFLELLKVNGLGPRLALRVLSGMNAAEFSRAVEAEDIGSLSRIPGLGRKTAERIVLALRGKLPALEQAGEGPGDTGADLIAALQSMGFDRTAAARAVESALNELASQGLERSELEEQALRLALSRMAEV